MFVTIYFCYRIHACESRYIFAGRWMYFWWSSEPWKYIHCQSCWREVVDERFACFRRLNERWITSPFTLRLWTKRNTVWFINQNENYHCDHIPLNLKGINNPVRTFLELLFGLFQGLYMLCPVSPSHDWTFLIDLLSIVIVQLWVWLNGKDYLKILCGFPLFCHSFSLGKILVYPPVIYLEPVIYLYIHLKTPRPFLTTGRNRFTWVKAYTKVYDYFW